MGEKKRVSRGEVRGVMELGVGNFCFCPTLMRELAGLTWSLDEFNNKWEDDFTACSRGG
jgi:hypothetical protein